MADDDKALVLELRGCDREIYLPVLGKAADRIEALSKENDRLNANLAVEAKFVDKLSAENERLVEQHEAFRKEVSDAVMFDVTKQIDFRIDPQFRTSIVRFIITKPDPLVEALKEANNMICSQDGPSYFAAVRTALAKRGLEIREKSK